MKRPPVTTIVHVLTEHGVQRAALVARRTLRGREVAQVWLRGELAPVTLHPSLVYDREADARRKWRTATAHQARLARAGARVRVLDAHLSLALADGGNA